MGSSRSHWEEVYTAKSETAVSWYQRHPVRSLQMIAAAALALAAPGAHLAALIKPQFEVGKGRVGKGGIVRDPALHDEVRATISAWLAEQPGWTVLGTTDSPIEGAEGNKEFLIGGQRR